MLEFDWNVSMCYGNTEYSFSDSSPRASQRQLKNIFKFETYKVKGVEGFTWKGNTHTHSHVYIEIGLVPPHTTPFFFLITYLDLLTELPVLHSMTDTDVENIQLITYRLPSDSDQPYLGSCCYLFFKIFCQITQKEGWKILQKKNMKLLPSSILSRSVI